MVIGGGLLITSIPFAVNYKSKLKRAINTYNAGLAGLDSKETYISELLISPANVGLFIKF
jgi:hypothetical protein